MSHFPNSKGSVSAALIASTWPNRNDHILDFAFSRWPISKIRALFAREAEFSTTPSPSRPFSPNDVRLVLYRVDVASGPIDLSQGERAFVSHEHRMPEGGCRIVSRGESGSDVLDSVDYDLDGARRSRWVFLPGEKTRLAPSPHPASSPPLGPYRRAEIILEGAAANCSRGQPPINCKNASVQ